MEYEREEIIRINPEDPKKPQKGNDGSNQNYWLVLTPVLIFTFSAIAYFLGAQKLNEAHVEKKSNQIHKLDEILEVISSQYVDSLQKDALIDRTIESLLADLDPHSVYIPSTLVKQRSEQLQGFFGGVGVRFIILRDTLMVTNLIPGGPAEAAGIMPGDRVLGVDTTEIAAQGIVNEDVFSLLKGQVGTDVELHLLRNQEENLSIKVTRGQIPLHSIDAAYMVSGSVGYIRLTTFSENTGYEFRQAIDKLQREGMMKLIFDLRNNGGGYLHQAINVADEFLGGGKLVVYTEGVHHPRQDYYATRAGSFQKNKLVVLINGNSASASEIVSGAIQDNDRGLIMGRRSFGKGLVQQRMSMRDSSELRLTVSRYYTPTGRCIQKPYGEGIDYHNDLMERYENGEMQHLDSSMFNEDQRFVTPKGKVVYGGGGIVPDVFIPIDTSQSTLYATSLTYSASYRDFCFDYVDAHRAEMNAYPSMKHFRKEFKVTDALLKEFTDYAAETHDIAFYANEFEKSKERIRITLKAEIAGYIWDTEAKMFVLSKLDTDLIKAVEELKKDKSSREL